MKLDFICAGAQKSGTTTLHDLLVQHKDIYLPPEKETKFFQEDTRYSKGLDFYKQTYFSTMQREKIIGEIDPEYMYFDYVPKRLFDAFGCDLKIIFLLRNPIKRAYSHYLMSLRRGYEKESFEIALELEKERLQKGEFEKNHFSYVDRGFYTKQIMNFLPYFKKENMKFIIFEEFVKDIPATLEEIYRFLNIEEDPQIQLDVKSNTASKPKSTLIRDFIYNPEFLKPVKKAGRVFFPTQQSRDLFLHKWLNKFNQKKIEHTELDEAIKRKLEEMYESEVEELETLINKDLSLWGIRSKKV